MRVKDVIAALERVAPLHLAEAWDRVGLQIGDPAARVRRGMLCIDLTEAVVREAEAARAGLVVAYHPPIFEPIKSLTAGEWKSRVIMRCVRAGIAVYSPHTALDAAEGGMNDWFAAGLGGGEIKPIRLAACAGGGMNKVVVFVPIKSVDGLRVAMSRAGAGEIGEYSECSFTLEGEGTFRGSSKSRPTVGRAGRFERVKESRMEMVCPASCLSEVLNAMKRVHPYEEPAYDVYRLEQAAAGNAATGAGRVLTLQRAVSVNELLARVRRRLGVKSLMTGVPAKPRAVRRVGVCVGAGGSMIGEAGEIDAFVTGEVRHHDALAAVERGVVVVQAGHTQTERPYLREYRRQIVKAVGGEGVEWVVSREDGRCWR
ncbi:MAG: Nif3-like dinuclear metal center hexameric protein [Planctomycetes bacterium]|nr:Nif3-like dinuclear metal center hexameric protein [Planctomycetota bacterium]